MPVYKSFRADYAFVVKGNFRLIGNGEIASAKGNFRLANKFPFFLGGSFCGFFKERENFVVFRVVKKRRCLFNHGGKSFSGVIGNINSETEIKNKGACSVFVEKVCGFGNSFKSYANIASETVFHNKAENVASDPCGRFRFSENAAHAFFNVAKNFFCFFVSESVDDLVPVGKFDRNNGIERSLVRKNFLCGFGKAERIKAAGCGVGRSAVVYFGYASSGNQSKNGDADCQNGAEKNHYKQNFVRHFILLGKNSIYGLRMQKAPPD